MTRLSTLVALFVSLGGCFLDTATAAPTTKCKTSGSAPSATSPSAGPTASSSPSASNPSANQLYPSGSVSASSSRQVPSGSVSASSSRQVPSGSVSASSSRRIPSGSASSTRPRPSGTASSSSADSGDDCPPHSTVTKTTINTVYDYVSTSTSYYSAQFGLIATDTITTTVTEASTVYEFTALSTSLSTYTETRTSYLVIPPETVITVPTASGFTAISCLAAYRDPTITSYTTVPTTDTVYAPTGPSESYLTPTVSVFEPTSTTTSTVTTDVFFDYVSTTITTTITRADATSTFYEACATNNVVGDGPFGSYLGIPSGASGVDLQTAVNVEDATECCVRCLNDPTCVVSSGVYQSPGGGYVCLNWATAPGNNRTCDPLSVGVDMSVYDQELLPIFISNSACGQYRFT